VAEQTDYKLVIEDDGGRRTVMSLALGEATVGRLNTNTVHLDERNVSRRHARLYRDNAQIIAEDLDSYNGLWVNGNRVSGKHVLQQGDALKVGDFSLSLSGEGLLPRREETTQRHILSKSAQPGAIAAQEAPLTWGASRSEAQDLRQGDPPPADLTAPQARPNLARSTPEPTAIVRGQSGGGDTPTVQPQVQGLRAQLLCVSTQYAGNRFELVLPETVLGRVQENDIAIDHRSVSRQHAKISLQGQRYCITDLNSANATLINGEPYSQTDLKHGDLIELGHVKLRFIAPGEVYVPSAQENAALAGRTGRRGLVWRLLLAALCLTAVGLLLTLLFLLHLPPFFHAASRRPEKTLVRPLPPPPAAVLAPAASPVPLVAPQPNGADADTDKLLVKVRLAITEHQWKRAQSLGNAVLTLEPTNAEVPGLLQQAEREQKAQSSFDTAVAAAAHNQWTDAWNNLQEMSHDSVYAAPAATLAVQVRTALVEDGLAQGRSALKNEAWDDALVQLEELEGLEPGRKDVAELRLAVQEARKKHGAAAEHHGPSRQRLRRLRLKNMGAQAPAPTPPAGPVRTPAQEATAAYEDGLVALKNNQWPSAIEAFNRCVVADKNSGQCYRALGIAHAKSGNGPRAVRYYRLYLKVAPTAADADQVRGLLQKYDTVR
jgi:pSer/pThr/pTyr-binding forkhead associated (FHA) protein/tetratricopeptide (TPR) repeat protein